jgi:Anti-sigma-28 factor, FlgM
MNEHREQRLKELKAQIVRGHYVVDASALADAIIERVWGLDLEPKPAPTRTCAPVVRRPAPALAA